MMQAKQERSVSSLQRVSPFAAQQLVLIHLPYGQGNTLVPVPGVVVEPGIKECVIRIRNLAGQTVNIQVNTNDLVAR